MGDLVVGIDVGGTKTSAVLADAEVVLREAAVPSESHADFAAMASALIALSDSVAIGFGPPAALVVGARGCDSEEQCRELAGLLEAMIPARLAVVNDAELLSPLAGLDAAVCLVSGTGSIAVGYGPADELLVVGGWGWLSGDEGSGAGIVREAARKVLEAHDLGRPDELLTDALLEAFAVRAVRELPRAMTRARGAAEWAAHCPRVFRAAEEGSPAAAQVIDEGGRSLAHLVKRIADRGAAVDEVVVGGGVITTEPALQRAFTEALAEACPRTVVRMIAQPPVLGAAALARELAGGSARPRYACLRRTLVADPMQKRKV